MSGHWFDSHENLATLANWLRDNRGWAYCKDNLLDVLETPWSWEKEWRLASGTVNFVEVEKPSGVEDAPLSERFTVDGTKCHWCDAPVGFVTYNYGDGQEIEWVTTYEDTKSKELACDDDAGTAANFAETTGYRPFDFRRTQS